MRLLIATPLYRNQMDSRMVGSVLKVIFCLAQKGWQVDWDRPSSVSLAHNRNLSAKKTIDEKFDAVLYWDTDMAVEESDFAERLFATDHQIIGLVARKKISSLEYNYAPLSDVAPKMDIPFQVNELGAGILLVRTEVFERIPFAWFKASDDINGKVMYEDSYFCRKAKDHFFPIYADPRFTVTHYGDYAYMSTP